MNTQPEALRLADWLEADACDLQTPRDAAIELRRLHEELQEQCRINGMGAEREARLMAVNQELVKVLKQIIDSPDEDSDIEAYENALSVLRKATGEQP